MMQKKNRHSPQFFFFMFIFLNFFSLKKWQGPSTSEALPSPYVPQPDSSTLKQPAKKNSHMDNW